MHDIETRRKECKPTMSLWRRPDDDDDDDVVLFMTHGLGLYGGFSRSTSSDPVELYRLSPISQVLIPPLRIGQPGFQMFLRLDLAILYPTARGASLFDGQRGVSLDIAKLVDVQTVLSEQGLV